MKKNIACFMSGFLIGGLMLSAVTVHAAGGTMIEVFYNVRDIVINNTSKMPVDKWPFIYDGTTYVPLRFVTENLGYKVDWNDIQKTIYISGGSSSGSGSSSVTTPTSSTYYADPSILSAYPNITSLSPGGSVSVTVTTNRDTQSVSFRDEYFNQLTSSGAYLESGDTRTFTINYTPSSSVTGTHRVIVYGSDANGVMNGQNSREFTLTIAEDRKLNKVESNRTSASLNSTVKVSVYTNEAVTKVKLVNDYDDDEQETTSYSTSSGERVFTFNVSSNRSRSIKYTAYVGSSSGYDSSQSKSVTVKYGSNSSDNSDISVEVSNYSSSQKRITVTTYDDIERIEIRRSNSSTVLARTSNSSSLSNSRRQWTVNISNSDLNSSNGTYYVYAFDQDDYETTKSFTMSTSSSQVRDVSISPKGESGARLSQYTTVYVSFKTDDYLDDVWVEDPNGSWAEGQSFSNWSDGSSRRYEGSFLARKDGTHYLKVRDSSGYTVTVEEFRMYVYD